MLARAGARVGRPASALAAAWWRSLSNEKAQRARTELGGAPAGADPLASDPMALLADAMATRGPPEAALAMSDPDAWTVVLSRFWNDDDVPRLPRHHVGDAPAEVAVPALRSSLVALGTAWPTATRTTALYLLEGRVKDVAPVLTARCCAIPTCSSARSPTSPRRADAVAVPRCAVSP